MVRLVTRFTLMTESPAIPRPSLLLKQMSPDRRRQAAQAFWRDESGANEQAEAIQAAVPTWSNPSIRGMSPMAGPSMIRRLSLIRTPTFLGLQD